MVACGVARSRSRGLLASQKVLNRDEVPLYDIASCEEDTAENLKEIGARPVQLEKIHKRVQAELMSDISNCGAAGAIVSLQSLAQSALRNFGLRTPYYQYDGELLAARILLCTYWIPSTDLNMFSPSVIFAGLTSGQPEHVPTTALTSAEFFLQKPRSQRWGLQIVRGARLWFLTVGNVMSHPADHLGEGYISAWRYSIM